MASLCPPSIDKSFGPWARECRGGFDFTLFFEDVILAIPLLSLFLVLIPFRLLFLSRKKQKVNFGLLKVFKIIATVAFIGVQVALLALWVVDASPGSVRKTRASVPAAALSLAASVGVCLLSYAEHIYSVRPSLILGLFLSLSALLDSAKVRTLWLLRDSHALPVLSTCALALKCVLFILETIEKRHILKSPYTDYPPEATSGPFSRGVFWWLASLFRVGYGKLLSLSDLFLLHKSMSSELLGKGFQKKWDAVPNKEIPNALFSLVLAHFKWEIWSAAIPRLCLIGFTFAQPFMIKKGIILAASPDETAYNNIGYGLIGAYVLVYVGIAVSNGRYEQRIYQAAIKIRGAVIPMIYKKTLKLESTNVAPAAALTLISTDIETILVGFVQFHEIWAGAVEVAIAIYLLQRELGSACGVPVGVSVVVLLGTGVVAFFIGPAQANWIAASEKRVSTTASTLGSIKWLKLSGLSTNAFSVIHNLRIQELGISKKFRVLLIWVMTLSTLTPIISPILTFITFAEIARRGSGSFTIAKAFTALSLFSLLTKPLSTMIVALPTLAGSMACFGRIQEYLQNKEHDHSRWSLPKSSGSTKFRPSSQTNLKSETPDVYEMHESSIKEAKLLDDDLAVTVRGQYRWTPESEPVIDVVEMNIRKSSFTLILGPVGCGKSTLLKCILGELPNFEGSVNISPDAIAYCDQTPWLPNATVREVIVGALEFDDEYYQKVIHACALEEDLQQWPGGDKSMVGSKGFALSGGQKQRIALARTVYSRNNMIILDDVLSGLDSTTENSVFHNLLGKDAMLRRDGVTTIVASSSVRRAPYADHIIVMGDNGKVVDEGSFEELNSRPGYVSSLDLHRANWTQEDDEAAKEETNQWEAAIDPALKDVFPKTGETHAEMNRRTGDTTVYAFYLKSAGVIAPIIFVIAMVFLAFSEAFPQLWLKWWAESANPLDKLGKWLGVYSALGVVGVISLIVGCWQLFIVTITNSGLYFHDLLLRAVSSAPMSFFSTVDAGVTINRFSQDLQLIDMELPTAALGTAMALAICIAEAIMMSIASKYIAVVFPFVIVIFVLIQHVYLRTSRQMRFLDIEHKAPLYSQLLETLNGLSTIRAFQWSSSFEELNWKILDESQRPAYLLFSLQRWLTFTVDMVNATMALILIIITVKLRVEIGPGYMGIALVNIMLFGATMKALTTSWVSLEITIGAVARIKNLIEETNSEDDGSKTLEPAPPSWPTKGAIEIQAICASFNESAKVLKNVSMTIEGGQKIGICGRTGSGKSSFLLTLFRLLELDQGSIVIDGIDISTIAHEEVRRRIVAVPQETYLFEGSVRLNADPSSQVSDEKIIDALQQVQLWKIVEERGGLDASTESMSFSQGQTQLFSLARAMLRESKILVLDEATSSLDMASAAIIMEIVRTKFADWTVIAVAHKLESVLTFDRVAVLDEGSLVEFGDPQELIKGESMFGKLLEASRQEDGGESFPGQSGDKGSKSSLKASVAEEIVTEIDGGSTTGRVEREG